MHFDMNEFYQSRKTNDQVVLGLHSIERSFSQGSEILKILKGVNLSVNAGEIVALIGPSGAGKSTLLHIAGLLESADAGNITICNKVCDKLSDQERTAIRRAHMGFVYQNHHLLPEFTALENIIIPQIIAGHKKKDAQERAMEILAWLNLKDRANHRPARLSGGEQQRVAIGRAIASGPSLLLADEPTGNLDPDTAKEVFEMLLRLTKGANLGALIATHNPDLAARMDRTVKLESGYLYQM